GEGGHFVTSPHVSPVFGVLMARQVEEFWELLGSPDPFTVVEVGAGDGTLARQILEALPAPTRRAVRYVAVERSEVSRHALAAADAAASVHGYRRQGLELDVLTDPGSRDITAGVDFEVLRTHALTAGLPVWGPVSQREALLALGFRDLDRRAQARQQEAIAA